MNQIQLIRFLDNLFTPLYKKIPSSHYNLTLQAIELEKGNLLDVACGDGKFMAMINHDHKYHVTGVDIFPPYLTLAKKTGVYDRLVKSDIKKLPFKKREFDIVFCSQAIEHLSKKQGFEFIDQLERISRKKVVIITPAGDLPQDPYDGNSYQRHLSTWSTEDFQTRGYKVVGQGLKILYGSGNAVKQWGLLSYVFSFISLIFSPLLRLKPDLGVYLFCSKDVK